MTHDAERERLVDLALGLLEPGPAREAEAHAAGCPACAAELASLREARAAVAGLPPLPAPERGEAVLLAAARQAAEAHQAGRPRLLPGWFWGAALGAATAAAVALLTLRLSPTAPPSRFDEGRESLLGQASGVAAAPSAPPAPAVLPAPDRVARAEAVRAAPPAGAAGVGAPGVGPAAGMDVPGDGRSAGVAGPAGSALALRAPPPPPATRRPVDQRAEAEQAAPAKKAAPEAAARFAADSADAEADLSRPLAPAVAAASAPATEPPARARATAAAKLAAPAPAPVPAPAAASSVGPRPGPPALGERRAIPSCPAERERTLTRDEAGRIVGRVRVGQLDGVEYRVEERFDEGGRLAAARVRLGEREETLDAPALARMGLQPFPGLRLAPTAAEAATAAPACGP